MLLNASTLPYKSLTHLGHKLWHTLDILLLSPQQIFAKKVFLISLDKQFFYPTDTEFSVLLSTGQSYQDETH